MAGFENNVMLAKNMNFDTAAAKPHLGVINAAGKLPIGTGNTFPTPEILGGSLISPDGSIAINYVSPNITLTSAKDLHTARYIVSVGGITDGANYSTIQSAINAAQATGVNQTVFIQPGTYTENLTLFAGINLTAYPCDSDEPNVTIVGKMTATFSGTCSISSIRLQTNGDYCLELTGANSPVVKLIGCYINATNFNAIHDTATGSTVWLISCRGDCASNTYFVFTAGAAKIFHSILTSSTATPTLSTFVNASCDFNWTYCAFPISVSGTGDFTAEWCIITILNTLNLTIAGTSGNNIIVDCRLESGTASTISVSAGSLLYITNCSLKSTNAAVITGAGTVNYGLLEFFGPSHTSAINTTTQIPLNFIPSAFPVVMPAGDYTVLNSDYFVGATTSAARAITLPAAPVAGETHRIKDITGTGAANNITVSGNGKNIDGAATFVINTNRGSIDVIYNGTEWSIV